MAFDSYRDFVNQLDKAGELKRISQPVATELRSPRSPTAK
jgi:3-polyprenyl-4-hydroxybenzoate decarboxylase